MSWLFLAASQQQQQAVAETSSATLVPANLEGVYRPVTTTAASFASFLAYGLIHEGKL